MVRALAVDFDSPVQAACKGIVEAGFASQEAGFVSLGAVCTCPPAATVWLKLRAKECAHRSTVPCTNTLPRYLAGAPPISATSRK